MKLLPSVFKSICLSTKVLSDSTLETPEKVNQEGSSRGLVFSSYLIVNNASCSRLTPIRHTLRRCTCSDKGHLRPRPFTPQPK